MGNQGKQGSSVLQDVFGLRFEPLATPEELLGSVKHTVSKTLATLLQIPLRGFLDQFHYLSEWDES
jgi:hypothetical protein